MATPTSNTAPEAVLAALSPDGVLATLHIRADRYGATVTEGATTDEVVAALAARPDDEGAAWSQADLLVWLSDRHGADWPMHLPPEWTIARKTAANRLWLGRIFRDSAWRRPHIEAGLSFRHFEAVATVAPKDPDRAAALLRQAADKGWTSADLSGVVSNPSAPLPLSIDDVDIATISLPDALNIAGRRWFADAGWRKVSAETIAAYNSHVLYVADLWREARERRMAA